MFRGGIFGALLSFGAGALARELHGLAGRRHALLHERARPGALPDAARPGDAEAAASLRLALDRYLAFEQFHDLARDGESQSGPAVGAREAVIHLPELVEDVG